MSYLSPEAQILDALVAHIETLSWVKTVNWQKTFISASDFRADQCPVVQIVADTQTFQMERNDTVARWRVFLEVVLVSEVTGVVDQLELLEKLDSLFKHVGSNYRLLSAAIPGLTQIIPVNGVNELHLIEPFYIGVLEFEIMYRKYFTGPC